jgi:phosphatidylglycerophosphatase C
MDYRVQADSSRPVGVAAFDFDGTLVRRDSFPRFLTFLMGRPQFVRTLAASSLSMYTAYGRSGRDGAKAALLSRTVAGLPARTVALAGEMFAHTLVREVRPKMAEIMRWHDLRGHRRILVSASLAEYLEPFGRVTGFDRVIATRLEVDEMGLLTGRMDGGNVRAAEKALRLAEEVTANSEIWAYGDSGGDEELLALADHPVWVGRRRAGARFGRAMGYASFDI